MLYQTKSLQSLIKGLRSAQQNHQEAEFIASSLQEVKNELSANNGSSGAASSGRAAAVRSVALQKLLYLQMLGVDISFAAFSIIEGMAATKFSAKRPAYAAAAIAFAGPPSSYLAESAPTLSSAAPSRKSLEQSQQKWPLEELSLLTINLFKKDLSSKEMYETGLALHTLCSVRLSAETVGAILPDVLVLLGSSRPYVRKKAALCCTFFLLKLLRKHQHLRALPAGRTHHSLNSLTPAEAAASVSSEEESELHDILQRVQHQLMAEQDLAVISCLTTAVLQVAVIEARPFLSLAPLLFHLLCSSTSNWLTLKLLKLFSLLCDSEPRLPAKLLQPLLQILEKTKAKSVEVEAARLALLHAPLEEALEEALNARDKASSNAALTSQAAAALTSDLRSGEEEEVDSPTAEGAENEATRESRLLKLVVRKLQSLLTSADRNLRFVALDVLHRTFERRRNFARRFWRLLPGFQLHLLQAAEEQDLSLRRVGVALLAASAEPETFAFICERLVAAAEDAQSAGLGGVSSVSAPSSSSARPQGASKPLSAEASASSGTSTWLHRGDFLLPVLRMAREGDFELVLDFEWFAALLTDIACGAPQGAASDPDEDEVAAAVSEQMLEVAVRVPDVRPCICHLSLMLLEASSSLRSGGEKSASAARGMDVLRSLRRQHREQAHLKQAEQSEGIINNHSQLFGSPSALGFGTPAETAARSVGGSSALPSVHPEVLRAASWIVGEYFAALQVNAESAEAAVSVIERATISLSRLARDATLPASCRRVVLWAALKLFLGMTAKAQKQQSSSNPEQDKTSKAAVARLFPVVDALCKEAASSLDAELSGRGFFGSSLVEFFSKNNRLWNLTVGDFLPVRQNAQQMLVPPEALDLEKPFVDLAELQRRLECRGAVSAFSGGDSPSKTKTLTMTGEGRDDGTNDPPDIRAEERVSSHYSGASARLAQLPWGSAVSATGKKKFVVIRDAISPCQMESADRGAGACAAVSSSEASSALRPEDRSPAWSCVAEDETFRLLSRAVVLSGQRGDLDFHSNVRLDVRLAEKPHGGEALVGRLESGRVRVSVPPEFLTSNSRLEVFCSSNELLDKTSVQLSVGPSSLMSARELKPLFFCIQVAYRLAPVASASDGEDVLLRSLQASVRVPLSLLLKPMLLTEDELASLMQVRFPPQEACLTAPQKERASLLISSLLSSRSVWSQVQGPVLGCKESVQISLPTFSSERGFDVEKAARRCFSLLASETSFHLVKVQTQPGVLPNEARIIKALFVAQPIGSQAKQSGDVDGKCLVVGFLACSCTDSASKEATPLLTFTGSVRSASSAASLLVAESWTQILREVAPGLL